ncbi:hypothetical protein DN475_33010 [Burkholderia multivorans]|nr:hypothetical protein DN475_33010 [Burkholderia multivorans]
MHQIELLFLTLDFLTHLFDHLLGKLLLFVMCQRYLLEFHFVYLQASLDFLYILFRKEYPYFQLVLYLFQSLHQQLVLMLL